MADEWLLANRPGCLLTEFIMRICVKPISVPNQETLVMEIKVVYPDTWY